MVSRRALPWDSRNTSFVLITCTFPTNMCRCIICAIFRLIYISTVDLNSNVTGTMPTTIFLFILEPNLAILCVSIPMLRPFYAKYKRRIGGSRLHEYSDERSTGFKDRSRSGQVSKAGEEGRLRSPRRSRRGRWRVIILSARPECTMPWLAGRATIRGRNRT